MKYPPSVLLLLGCCFATAVSAAPLADVFEPALKQWLGAQPGGVAAAHIDADGVTFFNAGRFDGTDSPPITPDTQFEIGSVSKVFTAALLADAVKSGKVSLDATVGAPFAPSQVTYLQLATHTSGLPRMPADFSGSDPLNPYEHETLARLVKSFDAVAPALKPAPSSYSNFGFAVLGQAVAGAWGKSYGDALRERVLRPFGLGDTLLAWREADKTRLAPGHNETGALVNWDLNAFAPAGALVSTSRDLAKFVQACLGLASTPLADVLADTLRPRAPGDVPAKQIGLAWQIEQRGASTVIWHNGATGGYHTFVAFDPAAKTGVVLLTNQARGLEALGFALQAGRMPAAPKPGAKAESPRQVELSAAELDAYVGHYTLGPVQFTVTRDAAMLMVQLTGQPKAPVFASAKDEFFYKVVNAQLSFVRGTDGKVEALILHQNGRDSRAQKVD